MACGPVDLECEGPQTDRGGETVGVKPIIAPEPRRIDCGLGRVVEARDGFTVALVEGDDHLTGFPARGCGLSCGTASSLDLVADARDDQGLQGEGGWLTHAAPVSLARFGEVDGRMDQGVGYAAIARVSGRSGQGDIVMGVSAMSGITITAHNGVHYGLKATIDRHESVLGRGMAADFGDVGPDGLWKLYIFKIDGARFGQGAVAVADEGRNARA